MTGMDLCDLQDVIPAKERVKKLKLLAREESAASFPRRRESISPYGTSCWMDPRIRGDDGLAPNSGCQSLFADFFTRASEGTALRQLNARAVKIALASAFLLCAPAIAQAGDWIADAKTGCKAWNPQPSASEAVRWSGPCKDGFADGKGVLDWLRGGSQYERDEGLWRAGRQTGEGTQTWPGGQYKGQFTESLPHGRGVLASGEARYDGAFLNGKPNGKGALTNASGTFDGTWSDGCFNDGKRRASFGVGVQSCP